MSRKSLDSFKCSAEFKVDNKPFRFFSLPLLEKATKKSVKRLPYSLKILLENLLRNEDGQNVNQAAINAVLDWNPKSKPSIEISFMPSRVVLQDFTGVPAIVDLAAMRDAMVKLGGDPKKINPLLPVELVIDHSVQVDYFGRNDAFLLNVEKEYQRNQERYVFLRWGQKAFAHFRVVPPGTGIVHQVNLEYLGRVIFAEHHEGPVSLAYPDTVVGTDSHTTMVNGLGILGWGVGGIEAEAAMLGQPMPLLIPEVLGFRIKGRLPEGATATDLVLTVTQMLRKKGVVNKFVEFYGDGLRTLPLADRATIGNMSPEYGSTCAIFPIDQESLNYLRFTGRPEEQTRLVEVYAKAQGMFHDGESPEAEYSDTLELDLGTVEPSLAGPRRPQDRVALRDSKESFKKAYPERKLDKHVKIKLNGSGEVDLHDGSVVIGAITSCTNTSNPSVMIGAGLVAKKAVERGLKSKPWVKTSFAPGSQVVTDYLNKAGLTPYLDKLGFNLVGYGCTTCIGNSGPLPEVISKAIRENDLVACSVLSGNRNFEGRINPDTRASYLASPPLVVAYALAGRMDMDLYHEPLGEDSHGKPVFLKDIWPSQQEISDAIRQSVKKEMFEERYANVFVGDKEWQALKIPEGDLFRWQHDSTYVRFPPFFDGISRNLSALHDIKGARVLVKVGDSVTTDHISPAGNIAKDSPAAKFLVEHGVEPQDFNSYGSRRGNYEIMARGTFANIRLKNELAAPKEGGYTRHLPTKETMSIFDAAMRYRNEKVPLLILAGKEYGSGSSRDWAAKGPYLLGIKAVIAENFERIHRSNLIGMGILPLEFKEGESRLSLGLSGEEVYSITGVAQDLKPGKILTVVAEAADGGKKNFQVKTRIDTPVELAYYQHGGILNYVLRSLA